jgi:hypothetical protein
LPMATGSHGIFCSPTVVAVQLTGWRLVLRCTSVDAYAAVWRIRLLWRTSDDGGGLSAFSGVRRSSFLLLRLGVVVGGRRFVYALSCEGGGVLPRHPRGLVSVVGRLAGDGGYFLLSFSSQEGGRVFFFTGGRPMSVHRLSGVSVAQSDAGVAAINKVGTLL